MWKLAFFYSHNDSFSYFCAAEAPIINYELRIMNYYKSFLSTFLTVSSAMAQQQRPNILYIMCDGNRKYVSFFNGIICCNPLRIQKFCFLNPKHPLSPPITLQIPPFFDSKCKNTKICLIK